MAINYKKELESAAKNMILVHDPKVLIRMILRMIVHKTQVNHCGILLYNKDKNTYVLTVSRGPAGLKIPAGFARMDKDNPLIHFFLEREKRKIFNKEMLVYEEIKKLLRRKLDFGFKEFLKKILYQMNMFEVVVCIPSYFRKDLLGILLLGRKKTKKRFVSEELDFFSALSSNAAMAIRNAQLFKELERELDRKQRLFFRTTVALTTAIDVKDHYTHSHTARVTNLSLEIARRFIRKERKIFGHRFIEYIHIASLLHDIGKIGVPEAILNKNGPLTEEEKEKMRKHPIVGTTILQPIRELKPAILGVKYHHERYDGSGYPEGLRGKQIPVIASIIAVADTFDAMTTDRPYRSGLSRENAFQEIQNEKGKQFDPQIVDIFVELYQHGKI